VEGVEQWNFFSATSVEWDQYWCYVRFIDSGCRYQDGGHQIPERPCKGHVFEVTCLIGRLH
jgi:hypothetical protein